MKNGYAYIGWDTLGMPDLWHADAGVSLGGKGKTVQVYGISEEAKRLGTQQAQIEGLGFKEALALPDSQIPEEQRAKIRAKVAKGFTMLQAKVAVLCGFSAKYDIVAIFGALPTATLDAIAAKQDEVIKCPATYRWRALFNCGHTAAYTMYANGKGVDISLAQITPKDLFLHCVRYERQLGITEWLCLHPSCEHLVSSARQRILKEQMDMQTQVIRAQQYGGVQRPPADTPSRTPTPQH